MDNVIKFTQKRKNVDGIFNLKINEKKKSEREDEDSLWKIVRSALLLLLAIQC